MISSYVWWELPGVYQSCEKIAEDLLAPRNVCWVFPGYCRADNVIVEQVIEKTVRICQKRGLGNHEVLKLTAEESGQSPGDVLVDMLNISWLDPGQTASPLTLLYHRDWPELTIITGLDNLSERDIGRWVRFLNNWSASSKGAPLEIARHVLLIPVVGNITPLPTADVRLSVRRFWNIPSQLEMRLVVRRLYNYLELSDWYWVESVLVELSGCDPYLLQRMVEEGVSSDEEIFMVLEDYARQFGWSKDLLQAYHADRLLRLSSARRISRIEPGEFEPLWRIGAVVCTPERGLELHSAAVALLGSSHEIRQRIWRGQASQLFPIFDAVRFDICKYLTKVAGPSWLHFCQPKNSEDVCNTTEGPVSQFGHLYHVIRSPQLNVSSSSRSVLIKAVNALLNARNSLAHYKYLSKQEFDHVLGVIFELGNTVLRT